MNTMKFLATAGVVLSSALAMAETEVRFANEWDQVEEARWIVTAVPVENANTDQVFKVRENQVDPVIRYGVQRLAVPPTNDKENIVVFDKQDVAYGRATGAPNMEEAWRIKNIPAFEPALTMDEGRAKVAFGGLTDTNNVFPMIPPAIERAEELAFAPMSKTGAVQTPEMGMPGLILL